jgi:hypothetical protein
MSARNSSQQQRTSTGQTPAAPQKLYQFKLVLLGTFQRLNLANNNQENLQLEKYACQELQEDILTEYRAH